MPRSATTRSFAVQQREGKLSGMKEGTPIAVGVNEADNAMEFRKIG